MKLFRKLFISMTAFIMLLGINPVKAMENNTMEIEYLDNGYYYETFTEILDPISTRATSTRTAKRTTNCKNSSGNIVWAVSLTASFTYTGSTSSCTSADVSTTVNYSSWKISNKSASKSGNKATATATGKEYFLGIVINTLTRNVALTCDKNGIIS